MKKLCLKIFLAAAVGAGATALALRPAKSAAPAKSSPVVGSPAPAGRDGLPVLTMVVKPQLFEEAVIATGTLRATESLDVQAEISGKLMRIQFTEGAFIRQGELLAVINDAELRASLQRAVYRRELAGLKVRRIAALVGKGGVPQQEYDIAASELNVLEAEATLIEAQLARTEIRAPFDGIIGLRNVSEGAFVTPSTKIATFQRLDTLKVDFALPEKYAYRIKTNSEVTVSVAGGDLPVRGRVYAIDPRIDGATRTVQVRALCPNPSGRLLSGGFVTVRLALSQIPDAILVPSQAIVAGVNDKSVFVLEGGKAGRRVVRTGTRTESAVQIVDGLNPGDLLITSSLQQLRAGQAVRPLPAEPVAPLPVEGPALKTKLKTAALP